MEDQVLKIHVAEEAAGQSVERFLRIGLGLSRKQISRLKFREEGIRIPEDISLISIDDSELAELSETRLTSVRHPADRLGAKAAENLLAMIRNTSFDGTYEFEPEIVERDSVKRLEEQ